MMWPQCVRKTQLAHSLDAAVADAGELELCVRIELRRRNVLLAVTGIRSGVLREAAEQRHHHGNHSKPSVAAC